MKLIYKGPFAYVEVEGKRIKRGESIEVDQQKAEKLLRNPYFEEEKNESSGEEFI